MAGLGLNGILCFAEIHSVNVGFLSKGYGALVLRLADEVVEALFVTYDLWK